MFKKFFFLFFALITGVVYANEHSDAVVLQYHRFDENRYPSTNTSSALFAKHLEYLHTHGFEVWPLSKIVQYLQTHKNLPQKTAAITIDDAYESVYTKAYPLLKKYHYPATVFVNSMPVIHHSKNFMSIKQMKEMGRNAIEFANHTHSHQYLARYSDKEIDKKVTQEVLKAEKFLEKNLHSYLAPVKMLAYPFGEYDARVKAIVKKLGYIGVAQNSGPISEVSDFLALTRFPMGSVFGSMKSFMLKVNTKPFPIATADAGDTRVTKKNNPPKFILSLKKPLGVINCFTSDGEPIVQEKISKTQLRVYAKKLLRYPRDHYTCTSKAVDGSWLWYSKMWVIIKDEIKE